MTARIFTLLCFITLSFSAMGQSKDTTLAKEWDDIDSVLYTADLPQTALNKVEALYAKAKRRNLPDHVIRALLYKLSLLQRISETDLQKNLQTVKQEITTTADPVQKAMLYTILACQYRQYYNNNYWRFYARTPSVSTSKADVASWTAADFTDSIRINFNKALQYKEALKQKKTDTYRAIVIKGNKPAWRPTLYDLVAHEMLDFFSTNERIVPKSNKEFLINQATMFAPAETFANTNYKADSTSPQWISLDLFRQLIAFHRNDADKNALVRVDVERIEWVYSNSTLSQKEKYYRDALQQLVRKYPSLPAAGHAWYLLAETESAKARNYQPFGDTTNRYGFTKALLILEEALALQKDLLVANELRSQVQQIRLKELTPEMELVNLPDKPILAAVHYRNVDTMYARIIRINFRYTYFADEFNGDWAALAQRPYIRSFQQALPVTGDYQSHVTQLKIDALQPGYYALLTSSDKSFSDAGSKLSLLTFHVSSISYVKSKDNIIVLNRQSGLPIPNARVMFINNKYVEPEARYTDKNGQVKAPVASNGTYRFAFAIPGDTLSVQAGDYLDLSNRPKNTKEEYERANRRVFFFTDRSIYRPGQQVFFKGIAVTKDFETRQNKLITQDNNVVYLVDANYKRIDSIKINLNSYGSFTGRFTLPQNTLTGNFRLEAANFNYSGTDFSVEEYKRPTFSVELDKPKGGYRLNDTIIVTGTAKAYAGNRIDGAKVSYNITRNKRFLDPWFWRSSLGGISTAIAHGETTTDAQGRFAIRFEASADDLKDTSGNPIFDFRIETSTTDINGETRTASRSVSVGFKSLILALDAPKLVEKDSAQKIRINTTNFANEKDPAEVKVTLYRLAELPFLKSRMLPRADQFILSKETFKQYFPNDEYNNEGDITALPNGAVIFEETVYTKDRDAIVIPKGRLNAGNYRVLATTYDKSGQPVTQVTYMTVFDRKDETYLPQKSGLIYPATNVVEPGEQASFLSGIHAEHVFMISRTETPETAETKKDAIDFNYLNRGVHQVSYTPGEKDRGGVIITEIFVYDNRVYTNTYNIDVPWSNKMLDLTYASYRDQSEPGNKETWTVSIKGKKGEAVSAELLTGMYDASLDQFKQHNWYTPYIWTKNYSMTRFEYGTNFNLSRQLRENYRYDYIVPFLFSPDRLQGMDPQSSVGKYAARNSAEMSMKTVSAAAIMPAAPPAEGNAFAVSKIGYADAQSGHLQGVAIRGSGAASDNTPETDIPPVTVRRNFAETAFFFPQLYADSTGTYSFSFTMPESLTQWKWMSLAHTKDLAFGTNSTTIVTQKKMMAQANAPRFMREGDNMEFSGKIVNMSDKEITGQVSLELIDPETNTSVDGWFQNVFPVQYFTVEAGQSFALKFPIQVPFSYNRPVTWRIKAVSGNISDGEENTLPVLTNRMLVTESLPIFLPNDTTQHFTFDKLRNNKSESLSNESITVEYSSNPVWNAVQALPYLMEYPYECAEQTFNRFYANVLAAYIVDRHPRIKQVFAQWMKDSASFKSNLQKNEELKQLLLQETPWVLRAENETQQKKNIALLFDLIRISNQTSATLEKLAQNQLPNGSFSWFKGGYEDRYITQYILTGIGKLKRLGALSSDITIKLRTILLNALKYADAKIAEDYKWLLKEKVDLDDVRTNSIQLDYIYMRSFFRDIAVASPKEHNYFLAQARRFWVKMSNYDKAELGLVLLRNNEEKFASESILRSLFENTVIDSKQGLYWKNTYAHSWYESPIEFQSMMIAFAAEMNLNRPDAALARNINAMKTWLLLNKQTNNWRTTIATADACYALLLNGSDWLADERTVTIQLGSTTLSSTNEKTEAGSGYFKKRIDGKNVTPAMGDVTVTVSTKGVQAQNQSNTAPSWGSVYWQYFEDLDKITPAASPLSIRKKLFISRNTDKGVVLDPVKENEELKIGDRIVVRVELRSDRDMDYLHLKDMRAASMEPVNVLSGYKWQDGLGYYESTKDASTNFFIDHLRKGTYVFDYPLFVTHAGVYSVGIASVQCMYAPEFTSHSEGLKIRVSK